MTNRPEHPAGGRIRRWADVEGGSGTRLLGWRSAFPAEHDHDNKGDLTASIATHNRLLLRGKPLFTIQE